MKLGKIESVVGIVAGIIAATVGIMMLASYSKPSVSMAADMAEVVSTEVKVEPTLAPLNTMEEASAAPPVLPTTTPVAPTIQATPAPRKFIDDFSDQTVSEGKWSGFTDGQNAIQILNDQLNFNTPKRDNAQPNFYSVSPNITDQPYTIANITEIRYQQQVNTPPALTRSELGIKLVCSGGGWLTLSINGNESALRLRYQTITGEEQTLFLQAPFTAGALHTISIERVEQGWLLVVGDAPYTIINDFDCSLAENIQFFADVQNCQNDMVSGFFDNVLVSGY